MGFMDKAKKFADQAQAKIDEVQKDFSERQGSGSTAGAGPAVEYDQHGRPVGQQPAAPPATPEASSAAEPTVAPPAPDKSPTLDPNVGTSADAEPAKREGDPLLNDEPGSRHGAAPPTPPTPPSGGSGLSSGDPLAG